ncbi:MAG TPA: hypothetical protein VJ787_06765 [Thermoleophilia bacterium]|nr:hypothetical protein [Thermoleophilia bacterium]
MSAVFVAAALWCGGARAEFIQMSKGTLTTVISALAINTTRWTGWIEVAARRSVAFEINYTYSAATAVTMRCETSETAATANDAGYDLQMLSDSATAGTMNSATLIYSKTVSASGKWTWTVSNLPHSYINCAFVGTGAPDANDKATIQYKAITP